MTLPSASNIAKLPKDGGENFNRLIFEDSLYLKHHAHQKIQWYPWGQAAFDLAKITNRPLFLSIGYSSCHWCHVMSETTFDRDDVAEKLNKHFVAIKIDRDQFPDIDQVYMAATQLLSKQGGWPNSVFCLPTGQPFYAGTYFAPDDRPQGPGFLTLLDQLAQAWQQQRDQIDRQAQEIERVIKKMNTLEKDPMATLTLQSSFNAMLTQLATSFDSEHGGFCQAPKFPPYATIRLLLTQKSDEANEMVFHTLDAMALGGIYDQIEGGFHRYSTDANWRLPHFEKMLTDNAQMIEIYSLAYEQSESPLYKSVVEQTIMHLFDDWRLPNGGFLTTIDADSDGEEGTYYVMRYSELENVVGSDEFSTWANYFQFSKDGNMRDEATGELTGYNIFHPLDASPPADLVAFQQKIKEYRHANRQAPTKDQRFLISANALLAKAFLIAARVFNRQEWQTKGTQLIDLLYDTVIASIDSIYVDDVLFLLSALVDVPDEFDKTRKLWSILVDRFYDFSQSGVWFSQEQHRTPISRIKDGFDRSEPSVNGLFILVAFQLSSRLHAEGAYSKALDTMVSFLPQLKDATLGVDTFWLAVNEYWSMSNQKQDYVSVQFAKAEQVSDDVVHVIVDLYTDNFLIADDHKIQINNDSDLSWLSLTIDPIVTRRFAHSKCPLRCATGALRLSGRFRLSHSITEVIIQLPVCSKNICHPNQQIVIPVVSNHQA